MCAQSPCTGRGGVRQDRAHTHSDSSQLRHFVPWTCSSPFSGSVAEIECCNPSEPRDARYMTKRERGRRARELRKTKDLEGRWGLNAEGGERLQGGHTVQYKLKFLVEEPKRSVHRGKEQLKYLRNRKELKEGKENTGANPVERDILTSKRHEHIISGQVNPKKRKTNMRAKQFPRSTEMNSLCYSSVTELVAEIHSCLRHI